MSYLIFCSFEVGGFPFRMAETLNRYGVETYYIFLGRRGFQHDSARFHYGDQQPNWDLSDSFQSISSNSTEVTRRLHQLKAERNILHCLATGRNAYLLKMAGIEYKYWSYGADIDQECFIRVPLSNTPLCKRLIQHPKRVFSEFLKARKSIRASTSVMISSYQFERLKRISAQKKMFFLPHYFKTLDYEILLQRKAENEKRIYGQIRAERYFFSSTRHVWSGPQRDMADNKRNDIILKSYAVFGRLQGDHRSKLVFVTKGPDVESSKLLSKSLRIQDSVVWLDEMRREELDKYYQGATVCFGQFGTPVITYTALEPLANGTISVSSPSLNNPHVPFYEEQPPFFSSKDPRDIGGFMAGVLSRKEEYADLSYRSWLWVQKNCSEERFVSSFVELFEKERSL